MTSNSTANTAENKHYGETALPSPYGRLLAVPGSLLAATLNPNCIGGDQSAIYLELTVLRWLKELVGFPTEGSAGLLLSGGTQATLVCLMAARHADAKAVGWDSRTDGLQRYPTPVVLYTSEHTHHCIAGAVEVL